MMWVPCPCLRGRGMVQQRRNAKVRLLVLECVAPLTFLVLVLPHEKLYLDHLPSADRYYKSFMHRDVVNFAVMTKCVLIYSVSTAKRVIDPGITGRPTSSLLPPSTDF